MPLFYTFTILYSSFSSRKKRIFGPKSENFGPKKISFTSCLQVTLLSTSNMPLLLICRFSILLLFFILLLPLEKNGFLGRNLKILDQKYFFVYKLHLSNTPFHFKHATSFNLPPFHTFTVFLSSFFLIFLFLLDPNFLF